MRRIFHSTVFRKVYRTILFVSLSILPYSYYSFTEHQNYLCLRVIRANSISTFFHINQGKAYSFQELIDTGFSEQELNTQLSLLVTNQKLIKIPVDSSQTDRDYRGNIYLLPRTNIVTPDLIEAVNSINKPSPELPRSNYFVYQRTIKQFLTDTEQIFKYWEERFSSQLDTSAMKKFTDYFLPQVIHIVGDDLETIQSRLFHTQQKLIQKIDLQGEMNDEELTNFFNQELDGLRKNMQLREQYVQEHNVMQELKDIVDTLNDNLPSLITIGREFYSDHLIALVVIGSWTRGNPNEHTDFDFLPVSTD